MKHRGQEYGVPWNACPTREQKLETFNVQSFVSGSPRPGKKYHDSQSCNQIIDRKRGALGYWIRYGIHGCRRQDNHDRISGQWMLEDKMRWEIQLRRIDATYTTTHDVKSNFRRKLQFRGSSGSSVGVGIKMMSVALTSDECFASVDCLRSMSRTVPGVFISVVSIASRCLVDEGMVNRPRAYPHSWRRGEALTGILCILM